MTGPFIWWHSRYDDQVHAFPLAQITQVGSRTLAARCSHSAHRDLILDTADGMRCFRCVLLVNCPESPARATPIW
ncbi:hypothetical protein [Kutzneria sp. 744]|uniref:hypothetical protein n=1 Tax=Kutzneria sp. (strain 744) TaxID=345341 RepID=UPI0004B64A7B|nr:hypothetical protein [Kutzneria sp. 744]